MQFLPKVVPMRSPRSGDVAKQQYVIHLPDGGTVFQSYDTVICVVPRYGKVTLDRSRWNYSATTRKYLREFLHEGIAKTREKIANGEYLLADLNS